MKGRLECLVSGNSRFVAYFRLLSSEGMYSTFRFSGKQQNYILKDSHLSQKLRWYTSANANGCVVIWVYLLIFTLLYYYS